MISKLQIPATTYIFNEVSFSVWQEVQVSSLWAELQGGRRAAWTWTTDTFAG